MTMTPNGEIGVAVIQLGYGDEESTAARVERVATLVRQQRGHDLVVLPELWSAGGFDHRAWADRAERVDGPVVTAIAEAAAEIGAVVHAGSIIEEPGGETGPDGHGRWNTSVVVGPDGRRVARYRKVHRFGFGSGEPKLLEAGTDVEVVDLPAGGVPDALRVGLSTCYDLRFPELYRTQLSLGAQLFLIPAAWPAARVEAWRLLLRARAVENQAFVVACNTAGTHARTEMGGYSAVIDPLGTVLAEAGPDQQVLSVRIDPRQVGEARRQFPVLADRRLGIPAPTGSADR